MDDERGHTAPGTNQEHAAILARLRGQPLDAAHAAKHLPGTTAVQRLLRRDGAAHVFTDRGTMEVVAREMLDRRE